MYMCTLYLTFVILLIRNLRFLDDVKFIMELYTSIVYYYYLCYYYYFLSHLAFQPFTPVLKCANKKVILLLLFIVCLYVCTL